jgi:hypothetical protein
MKLKEEIAGGPYVFIPGLYLCIYLLPERPDCEQQGKRLIFLAGMALNPARLYEV